MQYRCLADGVVGMEALPQHVVDHLEELPPNHNTYFDLSVAHQVLPTAELIASRARPEGIANANKFMRLAAAGQMEKRVPISVRSLREGSYVVADGNSTFLNALYSRWPDIPCVIIP